MSITLNPDLEHRIVAKVQSGRYQSSDDVIQAGLELLDAKEGAISPGAVSQDTRPIWEILDALGKEVPAEEWAKVPTDLSMNLDHYLYGAPKVAE